MVNINPQTNIRYGVISCTRLDSDVVNDLFYGRGAVNVSEEIAAEECRHQLTTAWEGALEQAEIAATETDAHMTDEEREFFISGWLSEHGFEDNVEDHIERNMDSFWDRVDISEPTIRGTLDGITYEIHWLGGAPLLTVTEGPYGYVGSLCSPCVPNAGDLESGFATYDEADEVLRNHAYVSYVIPRDWLAKEHA